MNKHSPEFLRAQLVLIKQSATQIIRAVGRLPTPDDGWDYYAYYRDQERIQEIEYELSTVECTHCDGKGRVPKES